MIIFDSEYLKQYIDLKAPLKVYSNHEWYTIPDLDSLESAEYAIGHDRNGKPAIINYPSIEKIEANGFAMDIDQLQQRASGEEPETPEDDGGEEGPGAEGGGGIDLGPEPGGADAGNDEEEKAPKESARRLVGNMIVEAKKKKEEGPFKKGDFVENINTGDDFCGSRGSVTEVDMIDDDSAMVKYRVFNYGYLFKPGSVVKCNSVHLRKIDIKDE